MTPEILTAAALYAIGSFSLARLVCAAIARADAEALQDEGVGGIDRDRSVNSHEQGRIR